MKPRRDRGTNSPHARMGVDRRASISAPPRLVKHSFRSAFAALLAALALACAGLGSGERNGAAPHAPGWRPAAGAENAYRAEPAPALVFLRGGALVLDGPQRRAGALPRITPGTSHESSFAAAGAHRRASGARIRRILTLALGRHLAAARDGTLSSRSTGVPPPVTA
jgi:hypothetical protein